MTLTAGLALLSWIYLILPYVHSLQLSWLQKSVAIAYPLGDLLVLTSDVAYGLIQVHGMFHNGTVVDLGWAVFYGGWGAAALHPTMTELTKPVPRQPAQVSRVRLTVLMLASLIAPAVLCIESFWFRGGT